METLVLVEKKSEIGKKCFSLKAKNDFGKVGLGPKWIFLMGKSGHFSERFRKSGWSVKKWCIKSDSQ